MVDATTKCFTSQRDLERYLGSRVEIDGCYYAVTGKGRCRYITFRDRSHQHLCSSYVNLVEFFMGSGEHPLLAIGENGGPVFMQKVSADEVVRLRVFPAIIDGVLEYARESKSLWGSLLPSISGKVLDGWLDVLMAEEWGDDPETLSGIRWDVNTQHDLSRHLIMRRTDIPTLMLMKVAEILHKWKG